MRSRSMIKLKRRVTYLVALALAAGTVTLAANPTARAEGPGVSTFVPVAATRIAGPSALGQASTTTVQVTGRGGVPASGVRAALVNVNATNVTAPSTFLTVWPGGPRPTTSNLHAVAGQTVSTSMVVQLSDTGTISIYNWSGSLNVAVDVQGYFAYSDPATAGGFVATAPSRVLDTRSGVGGVSGKVPPGGSIDVRAAGVTGSGVPANAEAVYVTLGIATPAGSGALRISTRGSAPGSGTALEFSAGGSLQNSAVAVPDSAGYVTITNSSPGTAVDILLTTHGYFAHDAGATDVFNPATTRVFDSRAGGMSTLASNQTTEISLDCVGGLPGTGMSAVLANVMVLNPASAGGVRIWPSGETEPSINNVIFRQGVNTASVVPVRLSESGGLTIHNTSGGSVDIVVDVQGWFAEPAEADDSGEPVPDDRSLRYSYRDVNAFAKTTEITSTAAGQQALTDLRDRQAARGVQLDTAGYRVYDTSARSGSDGTDPDQLIVPPDLRFDGETVTTDDATGAACLQASVDAPVVPVEEGVGAAAPSFTWRGARCYSRHQNHAYWFDICYRWGYVRNDGNASRDYLAFNQWGTCKSKGVYSMRYCGVGDQRKPGTTAIAWDDWAPRSDSNSNCRSVGLSIDVGPVGIGGNYDACERVDITKYAAAPKFSNYWRSGPLAVWRSERDVEYQVSMSVPQRGVAHLQLWWKVGWTL